MDRVGSAGDHPHSRAMQINAHLPISSGWVDSISMWIGPGADSQGCMPGTAQFSQFAGGISQLDSRDEGLAPEDMEQGVR